MKLHHQIPWDKYIGKKISLRFMSDDMETVIYGTLRIAITYAEDDKRVTYVEFEGLKLTNHTFEYADDEAEVKAL